MVVKWSPFLENAKELLSARLFFLDNVVIHALQHVAERVVGAMHGILGHVAILFAFKLEINKEFVQSTSVQALRLQAPILHVKMVLTKELGRLALFEFDTARHVLEENLTEFFHDANHAVTLHRLVSESGHAGHFVAELAGAIHVLAPKELERVLERSEAHLLQAVLTVGKVVPQHEEMSRIFFAVRVDGLLEFVALGILVGEDHGVDIRKGVTKETHVGEERLGRLDLVVLGNVTDKVVLGETLLHVDNDRLHHGSRRKISSTDHGRGRMSRNKRDKGRKGKEEGHGETNHDDEDGCRKLC